MIEYTQLCESNLEAVYQLLQKTLEYDQVPLEVIRYKTLEDPDYDPDLTVVAMSEGMPCGIMVAVTRQGDEKVTGGIKFMAVQGGYRNQGIATEMLNRVTHIARSKGSVNLNVGFTRPNYLFPGVDTRYTVACAFLLRRGFLKKGEAFNMNVDLTMDDWSTAEIETRLASDGIIVRRLEHYEKDRFAEWMAEAGYSAGWRYQALRAADADPSGVFVGEKGDEFVAFACYDGVRPGWFGPMGTLESMRGTGIGTVTFLKCLQQMKQVGYKVCEINSVGPLYFYSKVCNAKVSRIFWQFDKDI